MKKMEPKMSIDIAFNQANRIDGKKEFIRELNTKATVTERLVPAPVDCLGCDIVALTLTITPIFEHIGHAMIDGVIYDFIKDAAVFLFSKLKILLNLNNRYEAKSIIITTNELTITIKVNNKADFDEILSQLDKIVEHLLNIKKIVKDVDTIIIEGNDWTVLSQGTSKKQYRYEPRTHIVIKM